MGGSSSSQTVGYKYYLGMHLALHHGPADKLVRVQADKKDAWVGACTGGQITIAKEKLFGGEKREGGVSGTVDIEMGAPDQGQNSYLAAKLGALVPNFRGVCAAVLRQCYVGMNPYLKAWSFRLQRVHLRNGGIEQWYDTKAEIVGSAVTVTGSESAQYANQLQASGWDWNGGHADYMTITEGVAENSGLEVDHFYNPTFSAVKVLATLPDLLMWEFDLEVLYAGDGDPLYIILGTQGESGITSMITVDPRLETDATHRLGVAVGSGGYTPIYLLAVEETYRLTFTWTSATEVHLDVSTAGFSVATHDFVGVPAVSQPMQTRFTLDPDFDPSRARFSNMVFHAAGPWSFAQSDMNPAHIIRECLTDLDWGMGYQDADIDDDAFMAAADTLYAEAMGISLLWDQQIPLEDFIKEILHHIDATLYVDRTTGKFVLKLIRADYDPNALLVLDPSNVEHVEGFNAPALGELVNEVTVKYWDALTGEDASLSVQDIALVQVQGTPISATSDYPGFTNGDIAARVAARDLRALSTPLVSCTLYANRAAAGLNVGDCFQLDWPDYGAANLIMRVTQIALGDGRSNVVRITCVQDVFGLPLAIHAPPAVSEWTAPDMTPAASLHRMVIEAPYYELVQRLDQDTVDSNLVARPDLGYLLVAGDRQGVDLNAQIMVDAGAGYADGGSMDFSPYASLGADVGHIDETWTLDLETDLDQVEAGTHAQIGDEIVKVVSLAYPTLSVKRGVLDTVPTPHTAGDAILFWDAFAATDGIEYVSGETVSAKILPITGSGILDIVDATADSVTFAQRADRPYPPGQFKVNAEYWPETIGGAAELALTWAHRDRSQQTDGTLTDYSAASIGPEAGTAYTVRLYGEDDSLLREISGITGTGYTYAAADEAGDLGATIGASTYHTEVLADTPVAYYRLGEASGTTLTDSSGNGRHGTYPSGSGVTKGVTGLLTESADTAVALNPAAGSTALDCGFSTSYTSACTLEALVNISASQTKGYCPIIVKNEYYASAWSQFPIQLTYDSATSRLKFRLSKGDDYTTDLDLLASITPDVQHHVAAVYRASGQCEIWIDGAMAASGIISWAINSDTVNWKIAGATETGDGVGNVGLNGTLDEVAIYGSALSSTRIQAHYNAAFASTTDHNRNGRMRVELESVRYPNSVATLYAVPTLTGWDGSNWLGTLGLADAYPYKANPGASTYTGMGGLHLAYAKVAYGGGIHLAISPDGTCKTSSDGGATWTNRTGAPTRVQKLVYLNSQFIALTLYDLYSTTDGITWTLKKTFTYRPLDVAYGGSTWMVVGGNKSGANIPFASTSTDLTTWTDVSPTLTNWHGSNLHAATTAAGGTLQADFGCIIYSGSAFYLGGRFVTLTGGVYDFFPLVYKYASSTFTDCCPPQYGDTTNGGNDVGSLAVVDTKLVAAGFRITAYATLSTLTYSSWAACTIPSTPPGVLDSWVSVVGNDTDGILTTQNGGASLVTADGATFTAAAGVVADNPVAVGPSGGVTSWQKHDHTVYRPGWGFNYGMFYGGIK